jgi:hypothetical protein
MRGSDAGTKVKPAVKDAVSAMAPSRQPLDRGIVESKLARVTNSISTKSRALHHANWHSRAKHVFDIAGDL